MQPVKIVIEGGYWDSQIYSGELILLDANGALHKIDWRQAVDSIASQNGTVQTALRVAFSASWPLIGAAICGSVRILRTFGL